MTSTDAMNYFARKFVTEQGGVDEAIELAEEIAAELDDNREVYEE